MIQPVILCGGAGTRLWPLSREHHPKPLHAVNGERTLLQETALRCTAEPLVVCNESHRFLVQAQLRRAAVRPKLIMLESAGRGTAPALTLAAIQAVTADDPVLLAMPSDHFIAQRDAFQRAVERGAALARNTGGIVAFGFAPLRPSCSATMKRWPSLHTTTGSTTAPRPRERSAVSSSSVRVPRRLWSCFG